MVTRAAEIAPPVKSLRKTKEPILCHFTTVHSELKSRSYYMEFMPLAAQGTKVRYVSPAAIQGRHEGIDFIALPKRSGRLRHLREFLPLLRILLRQRASLYHFQDPELLPAAFILKLLFRKRIVFDCYEDFPSMALTMKNMPRILRPAVAQTVAGALRLAALCFDGMMTADPLTLRRVARVGRSRKLTFYNFPNLDVFPTPQAHASKTFDLVYRGGLSRRAGTWVLLEAMRLLAGRGKQASLLLIGYCDDATVETALRERIESLGLCASVEIRGRTPHREMARALGQARVGISPLQDTPKFRRNIPVKIFEYWACGLPVIASDLPPIRPFFRNVKGGILFSPGDANVLAQSIELLLDHPEMAARMGQQGRDAVVHRFNHRREVQKLFRFFNHISDAT